MTNTATYCPEDNKLRLYVGRVPREEYLELRAEGWTSTPKQACDFVATWTPERRNRCLQYADIIEDEDQGAEDRAADRAERFGEYRDKRTTEATGFADRYDAGPMAHGYQSEARAQRAARRHDRAASYACDAWSKAEYWQRRTAGVIRHALYKSTPGVRMGRIKVLEAELRRFAGTGGEWEKHLTLRLAYENQMLEAQGGRAAFVEMIPGGFIGEHQIYKVNKSTATGRVVSVSVKVPKVSGWVYKTHNVPGTDYALSQIDTERLPTDAYRPPTDQELSAFNSERAAEKKARPVKKSLLINPTDADAERLQAIWNENHGERGEPQKPLRLTQAQYTAHSGGTYSSLETVELNEKFVEIRNTWNARDYSRKVSCKVRKAPGRSDISHYNANRVVIITDKPQKPLPFAEMEAFRATLPTPDKLRARIPDIIESLKTGWLDKMDKQLIKDAKYIGWIEVPSMTQVHWTPEGHAELKAFNSSQAVGAA